MTQFRKPLISLTIIIALIGAWFILDRPASSARWQETDDAYLNADSVTLSPEVAGRITKISAEENQRVEAGDVIAQIDDRDYRLASDMAQAAVKSGQAALAVVEAQRSQQDSAISAARARLDSAKAGLTLARTDAVRYGNLADDGAGSRQARDTATAHLTTAKATLASAQAELTQARLQRDVLDAQRDQAQAGLAEAQAHLARAKLDLERTTLRAPFAGVVGLQHLRLGALVGPQTAATTIVPLGKVYIDANFRETQLDHVTTGQPVSFTVDALPGRHFSGHVASLAPASGASYAALPAHNATGNFTKIVQRLMVRIAIDPDQPDLAQLRVGMSARPRIDTASPLKGASE